MQLKISIGIPAYNEERNIAQVLRGILQQTQNSWKLHEVIVISDGSSDRTAAKARSIKHPLIHVRDDQQRKGKTSRLNQLFKEFTGDILVMFDGDIEFADQLVIENLIQAFGDPRVMLVGGNSTPFAPQNFVQRAVYSTFVVFYESRNAIRNGHNIFGATGSVLAIRKKLAKQIVLPHIISEDAYLYLQCLKKGYIFRYVDSAKIYYKLPSTLSDYIRQLLRSNPESVETELSPYFGSMVEAEFHRPLRFYFSSIFKMFLINPLGVMTIMSINLLARPFHSLVVRNYKLEWFTARTTH